MLDETWDGLDVIAARRERSVYHLVRSDYLHVNNFLSSRIYFGQLRAM